jgi:transposase InsO family protein
MIDLPDPHRSIRLIGSARHKFRTNVVMHARRGAGRPHRHMIREFSFVGSILVRNERGAEYRHTRPYSPQTNGMVERFNGRIGSEVLGITTWSHAPTGAAAPGLQRRHCHVVER